MLLTSSVLFLAFASTQDSNPPPTPVQEFFFVGHNLYTPRQGGRIADFQVRYRYKSWGFNYVPHYERTVQVLTELSDEVPIGVYWEDVAIKICNDIWTNADPPVLGVTCALQVGSMQHESASREAIDKPQDLNCSTIDRSISELRSYCSFQPGHSHGTIIQLGDAPHVNMPLTIN